MNKDVILTRVQHLTGNLKSPADPNGRDLNTLRTKLAQELIQNPELTVSGNRLPHEATPPAEPMTDSFDGFSHLDDLLERTIPNEHAEISPLIFRRETAFRNSLLGNSVPQWGAGMAPSQTFGPFLDEHGLLIWFDFFFPTRLVQVFLQGSSTPSLLIPLWGALTAKTSYRIEAGSAWIASGLIAKTAALNGFYTGLKIKGGSLDLSHAATISSGTIIIPSNTVASLHLDPDQNSVNPTAVDAGLDAKDAVIKMPETLQLKFPSTGGALTPGNASCTVFGCEVDFQFKKAAPVWIPAIGHILVPYSVQSNGEAADTFDVASSQSELCPLAGSAKLDVNSGWLLPAAQVDPKQLGQAAGTGALCVGLAKGISATWKGLTGADTMLLHPAILAEPGLITVVDFFASNVYGKQKWVLWRNAGSKHHSEITLTFGPAFPFIFIISALNSEAVFCFCGHKASLDRPVDANGAPFRIESTIALAAVLQNGPDFQAMLQDNDLLFDGNPNQTGAFERQSLALRNAFFVVSRPYSLFLFGKLENGDEITKGFAALMFGIHEYLPTLPDPYVTSYTAFLRDRAARGFGQLENALAGFVKWPNPSGAPLANSEQPDDPAYIYFRMAPLDQSVVLRTLEAGPQETQAQFPTHNVTISQTPRSFQTGVRTFNADLGASTKVSMPLEASAAVAKSSVARPVDSNSVVGQQPTIQASDFASAVASLDANPLFDHIQDKALLVNQTLDAAPSPPDSFSVASFKGSTATSLLEATGRLGPLFGHDVFMLLDVSSNADQMGVSLGNAFQVEEDPSGNTRLRTVSTPIQGATIGNEGLQLQILNMDVVVRAQNLRAFTLPQISWEPIFNIPLPFAYDADDAITTTPGLLVYDNDGIPTRIASESPYQVPIAPLPVTKHFLKEFNDKHVPQPLSSAFTLPFALLAQANFTRTVKGAPENSCRVHFHRPHFAKVHGGLQIRTQAPAVPPPPADSAATTSPSFLGWTLQWEPEGFWPPFIKWGFFGTPITGSTLGKNVRHIFNKEFQLGGDKPKVPLEQMEISGYGASIFSNWLDGKAAIALVSQATFEVLVGRTAHEVIQVRSILYPYAVHVVRTITLMRSPNGYVFRSDSGWKAESDGFYEFSYDINFDHPPDPPIPDVHVADPYIVLRQPVKGVSNVREIKDNPDAGTFNSSFTLNDPDLPTAVRNLTPAQLVRVFAQFKNKSDPLLVEMQAVSFDADVHFDSVVSGGVKDPVRKDFVVQSRKMLGYVQLSPSSILVPSRVFADLLNFQNGSLGGPVNCIVDIADSKQTIRIGRVDVNPALDGAGRHVFVPAARGSLILPNDGSWSVVKQNTDTGDVKPLEEGQSVPLIKPQGTPDFRIANPADAVVPTSKVNFGIVQSTGTQKLLFNIPQFSPGQFKLKSDNTYFADAYKLLNAKSVFPNLANALQLTNAEKEVAILGEGLMQMPNRDISLPTSLPDYDFINEPNIIRVYAQYKNTNQDPGKLALGIDSTAALADRWKAALSGMRVVVDLAGISEVMWVDGNFNASSGLDPKYDSPQLQFGELLKPVVEILKVLALLTGDDFDNGMDVGMSNSPDSWEYKFHCSQDIPVIQFPSPEELSLNPNPPLKLEAGLKVGFYFNEVLSVPTDLKQLVPACGAFVDFHGGMHVMCFSLAAASIYAVGQVDLGIAADTKAGKSLHMKFGFGVEVVVGLPVVANVSVLYMVEITADIGEKSLDIGAMMMFRGHAEICSGLVGITIQIEAGGSIHHDLGSGETDCIAQVVFSVNVTLLWVIDIHETDQWQETRQIA